MPPPDGTPPPEFHGLNQHRGLAFALDDLHPTRTADLTCTVVLTTTEWQALYMRIHKSHQLPQKPPTVRQAVRWIAQLGGFLARKHDGEPGITAVCRGWQRLQDIASTLYLVNQQQYPQTCG